MTWIATSGNQKLSAPMSADPSAKRGCCIRDSGIGPNTNNYAPSQLAKTSVCTTYSGRRVLSLLDSLSVLC